MASAEVADPVKRRVIWLVSAVYTLVGIALTAAAVIISPGQRHWLLSLAFLALFVAATAIRMRIDSQGFFSSANIVELPLLLALFYLPPGDVVVIRLLAGAICQVLWRTLGSSTIKFVYNLSGHFIGTSAAVLIVATHPVTHPEQVGAWLVLGGAVVLYSLITCISLLVAMTVVQGWPSWRAAWRISFPSLAMAGISVLLGLIILLVLQRSPWVIVLLVGLVAAFVGAYRSYSRFIRQHQTLQELYDLTEHVRATRHEATLYEQVLQGTRGMLRAHFATLWLPADRRYPEVLLTAKVGVPGLIDLPGTPTAVRRKAVESAQTVAIGPDFADEQYVDLRKAVDRDAIIVPLRSGEAVIGSLEVAHRLGDVPFQVDDVRLLETVAAHVGVAVENSRLVDRLRFDAYHDSLTGLPNRRRILQALGESVKFRAPGEVVAVLLFDVDGLRDVNDSLGHSAGDKLLAEVSTRLRDLAPPAALVGRVGSDEFVVTLRTENLDSAVALAGDLRNRLRTPMDFGALSLDVDTAVGVVVHPEHGSDPAALLQRADVAARAAELVPAGVQAFHPSLESRSVRRLGLANDLRRAIDNDELEIYFQPQVSLADKHLVGVECLARWEHATHGSVDPEDFVAVAEHTGQLSRFTEAVLREALRRCRQWDDAGRPLSVAVNLSARTLIDATFPDRVEALIHEFGVAPSRVTFEIAEDGVIGAPDRPIPMLQRLHDIGVRLSVDDFGSGYSSLSYLRRLPVQEVKIDRAFVQGMATDPGDLAIVRAVVDLARHFGLAVVAEGVESELTLGLLRDIGCDIGQGYLFSRPLPYERLEAWLGQQTEPTRTPAGEVRRLRAVQ